jgi:uncharacterized membrane protein
MDDATERYLDELRRNLRQLPEDERSDAVREIESHIAEGQSGWATDCCRTRRAWRR